MKLIQLAFALNMTLSLLLSNTQTASAKENNLEGASIELGVVQGLPLIGGVSVRAAYPLALGGVNFDVGASASLLPIGVFWGGALFGSVDLDSRFYFSEGSFKPFIGPRLGGFIGEGSFTPYVGVSAGTELAFNEHWGATFKIDVLGPTPSGLGEPGVGVSAGLSIRYIL